MMLSGEHPQFIIQTFADHYVNETGLRSSPSSPSSGDHDTKKMAKNRRKEGQNGSSSVALTSTRYRRRKIKFVDLCSLSIHLTFLLRLGAKNVFEMGSKITFICSPHLSFYFLGFLLPTFSRLIQSLFFQFHLFLLSHDSSWILVQEEE